MNFPGGVPISFEKTREKFRGLIATRPASCSTRRSSLRCSAIQAWRSRRTPRSEACPARETLNWAWFPGRRKKTTRPRATPNATVEPQSSSTIASARSIPAVTPADVYVLPSRTHMGLRSTLTAGYLCLNSSATNQWVVARLPSSKPASASWKAPTHTEAIRRVRVDRFLSQRESSGLRLVRDEKLPTTIRVSIGSRRFV